MIVRAKRGEVIFDGVAQYAAPFDGLFVVCAPPSMDGPQGWVMVEDDERTTEEMPKVGWLDMIPRPVCTCGFFPNPDCEVDHMGRNKPDPEDEKGGLL